ncbi:MAG TPA: hypothetical protein VK201_06615, partial [bacterium]|nr:hypothetical protein [bacterium]
HAVLPPHLSRGYDTPGALAVQKTDQALQPFRCGRERALFHVDSSWLFPRGAGLFGAVFF